MVGNGVGLPFQRLGVPFLDVGIAPQQLAVSFQQLWIAFQQVIVPLHGVFEGLALRVSCFWKKGGSVWDSPAKWRKSDDDWGRRRQRPGHREGRSSADGPPGIPLRFNSGDSARQPSEKVLDAGLWPAQPLDPWKPIGDVNDALNFLYGVSAALNPPPNATDSKVRQIRAYIMQQKRTYQVGQSILTLEFGDITASKADVMVSSDDSYLTMGGGVSAAIRRAAGQGILLEVAKKIPAKLGDVVVTGAGSLSAKHVFHAITIGKSEAPASDVVAGTTRRSMKLLKTLGLSSIAFPAIGAGVAGFAYEDVAVYMAEAIVEELRDSSEPLSVTIYLFDRFGRMQPIDYIQFFEEFATRAHGLSAASTKRGSASQKSEKRALKSKRKAEAPEKRSGVLAELAELDRERQSVEGRLAQYGGAVSRSDLKKAETRLKEIQEKRIQLLSAVNPRPSKAVSVFVSYSHADEVLRIELGKHLSVLEHQGIITTWHDRMIGAGTEWEGSIDRNLNDSHVILLLISSDFIHSRYCYDVEMTRALERHDNRQALVIPIILRAVALKGTPFSKLQALPKDAKPIATWQDRDSAFVDVTDGLRNAIQDLVGTA